MNVKVATKLWKEYKLEFITAFLLLILFFGCVLFVGYFIGTFLSIFHNSKDFTCKHGYSKLGNDGHCKDC